VETLRLAELTEDRAAMVAAWFETDAEARARFDLYDEHPRWWHLVEADGSRYGFIGWSGNEPVGFVDIEVGDSEASFVVMVRSDRRNTGLGRRLIGLAMDEAARLGAQRLVGYVEPDNSASLRCCVAAGLELGDADADALIPASTDVHPAAR
jgi:RimJ/RimL family protein N-acetyltransferase